MNANKLIAASLITLILPGTTFAQEPNRVSPPIPTAEVRLTTENVRKVLSTISDRPRLLPPQSWNASVQSTDAPRPSRTGRKIALGILGGVGGFFGGGYLGAKLERAFHDCNCDDPGLQGVQIGAPVGAILGAIAGVKLGG